MLYVIAARVRSARLFLVATVIALVALGCGESTPGGTSGGDSGCKKDADCAASDDGPVCDTASGKCGQCTPKSDTCPGQQACSLKELKCIPGCKSDGDCKVNGGSKLACDVELQQCSGCGVDADCPIGTLCDASKHCAPGCNADHGCASGSDCCTGQCADLVGDVDHCGSCTTQCSPGAACKQGKCGMKCDDGKADCNEKGIDGCEVSTDEDPDNCGGCGLVCQGDNIPSPSCKAGECTGKCEDGFSDCDTDKQTNGCETEIATDLANCGGCGTACSDNHVPVPACGAGTCNGACEADWSDCDSDKQTNGCETATLSDSSNCGGCGVVCSANNVSGTCIDGACTGACDPGFVDCDGNKQTNGCEVETAADENNCGGCGDVCSSEHITATCIQGVCDGDCKPGFDDCNASKQLDGCETFVDANPASCGGCGDVCSLNHIGVPTCAGGVCTGVCNAGYADCDGDKLENGCESDVASDPDNCGGCGVVCDDTGLGTRTCTNGVCSGVCATGYGDCDNNKQTNGCEIATGADKANCGGCGKVCSTNHVPFPVCAGGGCFGVCEAGYTDCNANLALDGCEANTGTDLANCGGCGTPCSPVNVTGLACLGGTCTGACDVGFADCDNNRKLNGCEVNLAANVNNCGGCGKVCSNNHVGAPMCANGACGGACNPGWTDCDGNKQTNGCEANTLTDPDNCGGCNIVCASAGIGTRTCSNGVCNGACSPGFTDCDGNKQSNGCETNTASSANACGACGKVCSGNNIASPTCSAGVCNGACNAGFSDCDGNKQTNGCELSTGSSTSNCGGCGLVCSGNNIASPSCSNGVCNGTCNAGFTDCDGNKQTNGCEANTASGTTSCGGCGIVCSANNMTGVSCSSGTCTGTCNGGFTDCDGNKQLNGCEANTATNPDNCGVCGTVCSGNGISTRTCGAGICNGACAGGFSDCDGNKQVNGCEINIALDPANCGVCNKVCSGNNIASPACGGGLCSGACNGGFADCDGNKQTNGCETNIDSNASSCGGCGKTCSANNVSAAVCTGGSCSGSCINGFLDCDTNKQTNGCETNPVTDANNCGGCGASCSSSNMATRTCGAGVCNGNCTNGFTDCDGNKQTNGCETNVYTSPNTCGGCNTVCSNNNVPSPTCTVGVCSGACAAGTSNCDGNKQVNGCETTIASDPNNCNGCNIVCSANNMATVACGGNACNGACAAGFSDCDNNKQTNGCEANPQADANNCGACGISCSSNNMATRTCSASTCAGTCATGYLDCDGNKLSNGCEINGNTDANNCNNCGNVCPVGQSCNSGVCGVSPLYTFSGVKTNLPIANLTGWAQCHLDTYATFGTPLSTILAACNKANLLVGCRAAGSSTLLVAAEAPRVDVTFDVGTGSTASHAANGVAWYYNGSSSWGFANGGDAVSRNSCDTAATNPTLRVCWHTGSSQISSGYRCGSTTSSSSAYERLIYHAN